MAQRGGRRSAGASPNQYRHGPVAVLPACRQWAAWLPPPSPAASEPSWCTGGHRRQLVGLYLGVPETDHVVGVAAVLAVLLVASLAAPRRASWVLVVGLDVVLAWAAVRGAPAGGPPLVAGLAMPGLLVVAPLTSHLPGPAARHRARLGPAGRVGRSAGRLRRRHRPHCGTDRHDRDGRGPSLPSGWSCSSWLPAWPSEPDHGEAGDRRRRSPPRCWWSPLHCSRRSPSRCGSSTVHRCCSTRPGAVAVAGRSSSSSSARCDQLALTRPVRSTTWRA